MGKIYVRVDDRLIHGQTLVAWCPTLGIDEIIGVENNIASNAILKSITEMGIPKPYKGHIVKTDEVEGLLKQNADRNTLIIVKYPSVLFEIKEAIKGAELIILGNMAKRDDTNHQLSEATGIFYLSDSDIEGLDTLVKEGFEVIFQQVPSTGRTTWDNFKKTL